MKKNNIFICMFYAVLYPFIYLGTQQVLDFIVVNTPIYYVVINWQFFVENYVYIIITLSAGIAISVFAIINKIRGHQFPKPIFAKVPLSNFGKFFALGYGFNVLVTLAIALISNLSFFDSYVSDYSDKIETISSGSIILMIVVTGLLVPIFEEYTFRDLVMREFAGYKLAVVVVIQAVIFGVGHLDLIQGSYAFVCGIVMGLCYIKYRNIWYPIAFHMGINLISALSSALLDILPAESFAEEISIYTLPILLVSFTNILMLVLFPILFKNLFLSKKREP